MHHDQHHRHILAFSACAVSGDASDGGLAVNYSDEAYRACLNGNADKNQQYSCASQIILLHAIKGELLDTLKVCVGHMTGGMDGDYRNEDPVKLALRTIEKAEEVK